MQNWDGETKITLKAWCVITLMIGIFGFFFVTAMAHESRLTKVETTLEVNVGNMTKSIECLSTKMDRLIERGK